jgi:hypothetical protein
MFFLVLFYMQSNGSTLQLMDGASTQVVVLGAAIVTGDTILPIGL